MNKDLDTKFSTLIKQNYEKIKASTPVNPSISLNDEWRNDCYDDLYNKTSKPKIILISAKAQHGKDTTANILKEQLEERDKKVLIAHFGDLLKYICRTFFNWNGVKDEQGRSILQRAGTDIIRKQRPSYWVDFIKDFLTIFPDEWDYVIIPDCRFKNEVKWGADWNTKAIRVTRLNFISPLTKEQQAHISETDLDDYPFDFYIQSESGIENVKKAVLEIIEDII